MPKIQKSSIADDEIARFSEQSRDWWNPTGTFAALHRLNPVRLAYIRDQICAHFGRKREGNRTLANLDVLDVGCGGGILTEPMIRLGASVTGLDASKEGIAAARKHAAAAGLAVTYRVGSIEDAAKLKTRFDVVTALEILEHVADLDIFIAALSKVVKPGGILILSTLNRTPQSFLLGIVAAEYILNLVPRGTHQWKKFVRPSELAIRLEKEGLYIQDICGVVPRPIAQTFELRRGHTAVNYMLTAIKPI